MTDPLFLYGTCLDPDVLALVLGRVVELGAFRPATLFDHRTVHMPDQPYPILETAPGERVRGALFEPAGEADLDRLGFFESYEYEPVPCRVRLDDGTGVDAVIYAGSAPDDEACPRWSLCEWQREHKSGYLELTRRFMAHFEAGALDAAEREWDQGL